MEIRPCIDIHDGRVKQIVGGSLSDQGAVENFISEKDAAYYASIYRDMELSGGHVIILNRAGTAEYEASMEMAKKAFTAYPGGLQAGGGINPDNAQGFLGMGASAVIVTSYVFRDGRVDMDRLKAMSAAVGRERLVLDLSCRRKAGEGLYVVTDRWQKYTDEKLGTGLLERLEEYAGEYLVHAADVEGKAAGIDEEALRILGEYEGLPVTYAGGVHEYEDIEIIKDIGKGRVNVTVGSALSLFGGKLKLEKLKDMCKK
ncbi:MAG: phosphoribosylformimino-5-aminoimidazole carboxamide ribotide isomerase [Lachnospiraceae bacterium]|nr:phosphoribosylformimino-5-aminoimidazole carboxamide ribotide isomerase [Lachnospiraceae bacterium]